MVVSITVSLFWNKSPNRAMCTTIVDETGSCRLLIMLGDGGARCWVTNVPSVLIRCYHRRYFRHHFLIIITYGSDRLLVSMKKEVSGTFPFTCLVTALPVFYRRGPNVRVQLSPPLHLVTKVYQLRRVSALSVSCQSS